MVAGGGQFGRSETKTFGSGSVTPPPTPNPTPAPVTPAPIPSPTPGAKVCPSTKSLLKIDVRTDAHPGDTSWLLHNLCDHALSDHAALRSGQFAADSLKEVTICLPLAQYEFVIMDSQSDGLQGPGYYSVEYGREQVASGGSFGYAEKTYFGECPAPAI